MEGEADPTEYANEFGDKMRLALSCVSEAYQSSFMDDPWTNELVISTQWLYEQWFSSRGSDELSMPHFIASRATNVIDTLCNILIRKETAFTLNELYRRCESPIEKQLIEAVSGMLMLPQLREVYPQWEVKRDHRHIDAANPQRSYRLDFAIPKLLLAWECDGHDYHSSRQQRGLDARRDRELQSSGWSVIRFTGTEIHADAPLCAEAVMDAARTTARKSDDPITRKLWGE